MTMLSFTLLGFGIPFLISAAITVALFRSGNNPESSQRSSKLVVGLLFVLLTGGIGCAGLLWGLHPDLW